MKVSRSEPGLFMSAAVHLGVLAFLLVHFSQEPKFDDAQEAVPVETISDAQFSQIMKGEKTAKSVAPKPRVDRVAEVEEQKPVPPTPQAHEDVPAPPPPLKRLPDPADAQEQPPLPPARPPEPKPEPKAAPKPEPKHVEKTEEKEEPEKDDAEPVRPPPRPKPAEKRAETKPEPPKPPELPKPKPPKLDEVAKLLAETKDVKARERPSEPHAQPRASAENNARAAPNLADVSRLLSREPAQSRGSSGREVSHAAALGAASGRAAKMSPSMADAFDSFLRERYKQCWNYLSFSDAPRYVPRFTLCFARMGRWRRLRCCLIRQPTPPRVPWPIARCAPFDPAIP